MMKKEEVKECGKIPDPAKKGGKRGAKIAYKR